MVNIIIYVLSVIGVILSYSFFIVPMIYLIIVKKLNLSKYVHEIAVANDVLMGSIFYGSRHTISAITGKRSLLDKRHLLQASIIDFLFYKNHCITEAIVEGLVVFHDLPILMQVSIVNELQEELYIYKSLSYEFMVLAKRPYRVSDPTYRPKDTNRIVHSINSYKKLRMINADLKQELFILRLRKKLTKG